MGSAMNRLLASHIKGQGLKGLPLALQMIAIPVGALVAAQVVTLALTVLLPPRPAARWNLDDVATALGAGEIPEALERRDMKGPPDVSGQGWLVSESSREALATRLDKMPGDVILAFYTQLPVGGVAVPANARSPLAEMETDSAPSFGSLLVETAQAQTIPGGPPPGGVSGPAGMPGGGFPGGMPPGAGSGPRVPSMPGGRMPGGVRPPSTRPGGQMPGATMPGGQRPGAHNPGGQNPGGQNPGGQNPGGTAPGGQTPGTGVGTGAGTAYDPATPGAPGQSSAGIRPGGITPGGVMRPFSAGGPQGAGNLLPRIPGGQPVSAPVAAAPLETATPEPSAANDRARATAPVATIPVAAPRAAAAEPDVATTATPLAAREASPQPLEAAQPIPFRRQRDSIFSMASPPFIEGDFVAAARQPDGSWLAVAPREQPFPNAWQQRVILWFALSLLIISPLAWLFARRIVLPLREFAHAAEKLGRDPSASISPLSGPAEIGGAANAFNQMRHRLRAFVDDRTTMVGAISHDLRTPLTRLRFRIEDVPDEQRDGLLKEVTEMEAMISQVINFIHDASAPGAREMTDIADLVASSVEDARLIGADITIESREPIRAEVDRVGIRRLLGNLLENAAKYGEHAKVRVRAQGGEAIVEIVDAGPGIPEEEFDRAFEPFYRGHSARTSDKAGSGLGLAVCRSIARAHGGDVSFAHSEEGFLTRLALPAAYRIAQRKAG